MKFLTTEAFKSQDLALLIVALTIPMTIFLLVLSRIFGVAPMSPEAVDALENIMGVALGAVSARLVGPSDKNGANSNGNKVEPPKA